MTESTIASFTGVGAVLAWLLVFVSQQRRAHPAGRAFTAVVVALALYLSASVAQMMLEPLEVSVMLARVQLALSALGPALWLVMVARFAELRWAPVQRVLWFALPSVAAAGVMLFGPHRPGWLVEGMTLGPGGVLEVEPGPLFWLLSLPYAYVMVAGALLLLLPTLRRGFAHDPDHHHHAVTIAIAIGPPVLTATLRATQLLPLPLLESTALGVSVSALALLLGLVSSNSVARPDIGFREVFEAMHEAALVVAPDGTILEANPAAVRLLGEEDVASVRGEALLALAPQLETARRPQGRGSGPRQLVGEFDGFTASVSHLRDGRRRLGGSVIVVHDERQGRVRERRLLSAANTDALTGAANRSGFEQALRDALARHEGGATGLLYVDLDGFKPVNDSYGHAVGDEVLIEVVKRLNRGLRDGDLVGRMGGDEFALLLVNVTPEGLAAVASRVRESMLAPMVVDGIDIHIGASLGVASAPRDGKTIDKLLEAADGRMYREKRAKPGRAKRIAPPPQGAYRGSDDPRP